MRESFTDMVDWMLNYVLPCGQDEYLIDLEGTNMDTSGSVKFTDLKKLVAEHLKNGLGIDHFVITYAEHVETANQWKVDVEFKTDGSGASSTTAAISLDDKSGEVKTFLRGRKWS
jgi:hypothetical protein